MSPANKFWLTQARFGLVVAIGMVLSFAALARGEAGTAAVAAAITIAIAIVVYAAIDRPRARSLDLGKHGHDNPEPQTRRDGQDSPS